MDFFLHHLLLDQILHRGMRCLAIERLNFWTTTVSRFGPRILSRSTFCHDKYPETRVALKFCCQAAFFLFIFGFSSLRRGAIRQRNFHFFAHFLPLSKERVLANSWLHSLFYFRSWIFILYFSHGKYFSFSACTFFLLVLSESIILLIALNFVMSSEDKLNPKKMCKSQKRRRIVMDK